MRRRDYWERRLDDYNIWDDEEYNKPYEEPTIEELRISARVYKTPFGQLLMKLKLEDLERRKKEAERLWKLVDELENGEKE